MRTVFFIIIILALSSCIRYNEVWRLNTQGGGTVQIICEPSPDWLKHAGATNWFQAALLFIPPYKSLSQDFARVGAKINHCKFFTKKGKPKVDILISFDSLSQIARSSLFSDRMLQWRKNPFTVTLLHRLSTKRPLGKAEMACLDDGILSDAQFDLKMFLPGRVIKIEGAKKKNNCVFINANLNKLALGDAITITAVARIAYPLWFKLLFSLTIILFIFILLFFLRKKFFNSKNAHTELNTQSL